MNPEQFIPGQTYTISGKRTRNEFGNNKIVESYTARGIFAGYEKTGSVDYLVMQNCIFHLNGSSPTSSIRLLLPYISENPDERINHVVVSGTLTKKVSEIVVYKNRELVYPISSFVSRHLKDAIFADIEFQMAIRRPSKESEETYHQILSSYGNPNYVIHRSSLAASLHLKPADSILLEKLVNELHQARMKRQENNRATIKVRVQTYH